MATSRPLLDVRNLSKHFPRGRQALRAVDDVSFTLHGRQTLGVVGESGCGKSTLARTILRLIEPSAGQVYFDGVDLTRLDGRGLRAKRADMQMIFQDPFASLNPQMTAGRAVEDPLIVHARGTPAERKRRVAELLDRVGVGAEFAGAFPHEFSGGQQQRIGIARALALQPKLVVCDEPLSALDVSIQAQIIALLKDLQRELGLTYIFISHNLAAVEYISDAVAVMYLGQVVEITPTDRLFAKPLHPYTRALIASVPRIPRAGEKITPPQGLEGEVPSPLHPPAGCRFHTRCPLAEERCRREAPVLRQLEDGHMVSCHLA